MVVGVGAAPLDGFKRGLPKVGGQVHRFCTVELSCGSSSPYCCCFPALLPPSIGSRQSDPRVWYPTFRRTEFAAKHKDVEHVQFGPREGQWEGGESGGEKPSGMGHGGGCEWRVQGEMDDEDGG